MSDASELLVVSMDDDGCHRIVYVFELLSQFPATLVLRITEVRVESRASKGRRWTTHKKWRWVNRHDRMSDPRPDIPADVVAQAQALFADRVRTLPLEPVRIR